MELDKPKEDKSVRGSADRLRSPVTGSVAPVPVEVRQPDPGALENLRSLIAPPMEWQRPIHGRGQPATQSRAKATKSRS